MVKPRGSQASNVIRVEVTKLSGDGTVPGGGGALISMPTFRVTRRDGSIMSEEGEVAVFDDGFVGCAGAELVSRPWFGDAAV